jgi:intracellular sulfur oxidation DsrE/DsrF family protein
MFVGNGFSRAIRNPTGTGFSRWPAAKNLPRLKPSGVKCLAPSVLQPKIPVPESEMKNAWIGAVAALALFMALPKSFLAQSAQALPIPSVDAAIDFPNAHEMPDPSIVYKIVFDIGKAAPKVDDVNPSLEGIARYYNTLAKGGVPADHRKFVVVFHQGGTDIALNNAAFKAVNDGHDNPNIPLLRSMKQAGIDFRVCGQGVLGRKYDMATIQPEIQIDQWAMTTITTLQLRGYIRVAM